MAVGPAQLVDLALVLAMDCSGSISRNIWPCRSRATPPRRTIQAGHHGRIALTFLQWSEVRRAEQVVPWTWVDGLDAATQFAALVRRAAHPMASFTSISGAIDRSIRLLSESWGGRVPPHHRHLRRRRQQRRPPRHRGRDDALAAGVTINGLPIQGNEPWIEAYYRDQVIGGPHCFIMPARKPHDFAGALLRKMLAEVAGRQARDLGSMVIGDGRPFGVLRRVGD
jgi:hypothetical protein